jgi:hypothetical protein
MSDDRIVCRYAGAQISNSRLHVRIRFDQKPKRKVPGELWNRGFRRDEDGSFFKAFSPMAAQQAQAVLTVHYGEQIQ